MPDFAPAAGLWRTVASTPGGDRGRRRLSAGMVQSWTARWPLRLKLGLMAVDAVMIIVAFLVTHWVRFGAEPEMSFGSTPIADDVLILGALVMVWMLFLAAGESRRSQLLGAGLEEYSRVIKASFQTFGAIAIVSYLLQFNLSRFLFLTTLPLGLFLVLLGRWVSRLALNRARAAGRALIPTILVGDVNDLRSTLRDLTQNTGAGYLPRAVCLTGVAAKDNREEFEGYPVVTQSGLAALVRALPFSAVIVAGGLSQSAARHLAWQLESARTLLLFVPRLTDAGAPRMSFHGASGINLIQIELPKYSGTKYWLKRGFDVAFSIVALVLLSPVLAVIAIAVKAGDGGPVLFRQERVGLKGRPFKIDKFRTMHLDAEARLESLRSQSIGNGPLFKMDADPRVTPVGRFLRKYSLDELPQFWTVLRGDMSIVGPRPHLAHELAEFPENGMRRLLIKPGITGLWQIGGRSDLALEDAIRMDLRYVENWSLAGDISIILKTVRAVLRPRGAY